MGLDKMAPICPDFKWLGFHLKTNLFLTIQNQDWSGFQIPTIFFKFLYRFCRFSILASVWTRCKFSRFLKPTRTRGPVVLAEPGRELVTDFTRNEHIEMSYLQRQFLKFREQIWYEIRRAKTLFVIQWYLNNEHLNNKGNI